MLAEWWLGGWGCSITGAWVNLWGLLVIVNSLPQVYPQYYPLYQGQSSKGMYLFECIFVFIKSDIIFSFTYSYK